MFQKRYVFVDMDYAETDSISCGRIICAPTNEWFHTCCFTSHQHHLKHATNRIML